MTTTDAQAPTAPAAAPLDVATCPIASLDVYDADQYSTALPLAALRRLRAEAPVFRHVDPQREDGFWLVTRHADVEQISRNPELFSSHAQTALLQDLDAESLAQTQLLMLNQDPPDHTRTRSLVNRGFTPRMIGRLEDRIYATCCDIVDAALGRGEGDFVTLCAAELPLVVIAELMGVPQEDRHKVFEWSNKMIGFDDPEFQNNPEDGKQASLDMFMYANSLAEVKKAALGDDIVSKLLTPDESGNALNELEFDMFFLLLAVAGNETTRNALSGGMLALIENPEQWDRLRADHSLLPSAADEIVRWVSPVIQFRRTAMADCVIGSQPVKAGDKILINYTSANRDETVFTDPDTFDIGRSPNPHLGFGGGGPHFCLGRHLAKLEVEQLLRALVERVERVELVRPARRLRSSFINGIKEMPVRFVPAAG